jgi:DNA-binding transcriptional regulator YiaG
VVRKVGRRVPPRHQTETDFDPKVLITKRLGAGMTQKQLAVHLGVSPRSLWNWEAGTTTPTPEFWPRVHAFLAS